MKPLLALLLLGCSSVPDLVFEQDAGNTKGGDAATSLKDATVDAPPLCNLAQAGDQCCGQVVCRGDCSVANCDACSGKCGVDEVCCAKNSIVCKPRSAACN